MLMRAIAASTLLLVLSQGAAMASDKPGPLRRMSCAIVRFYVAKYSAAAAETWARSHGATDAEIDTARQCLPTGPNVETAAIK
jgi:hypothetical protein